MSMPRPYNLQQLCDDAGPAAKSVAVKSDAVSNAMAKAHLNIRDHLFEQWWAEHPAVEAATKQYLDENGDDPDVQCYIANWENSKGEQVRRVFPHHAIRLVWDAAMREQIEAIQAAELFCTNPDCDQHYETSMHRIFLGEVLLNHRREPVDVMLPTLPAEKFNCGLCASTAELREGGEK